MTNIERLVGCRIKAIEFGNHPAGDIFILLHLSGGKQLQVSGWEDIGYGPFPPAKP
jgi:hypothetical protein